MDEDPQEIENPRERGALLVRWLLWVPLVACSACLLIFTLIEPALPPPGSGIFGSVPRIPQTGADPLIPPTLTPAAPAAPATPVAPTPVPPEPEPALFSYADEAAQRLDLCSEAFHTFFILEQTAFHNPETVTTDRYQSEAGSAMQAFREACLPLGQMPTAPSAYRDVDRWLKLAAGEVAPAADTFNAVLSDEKDSAASLERALDHMMRFIEYTNRAHDLLRRLDRRKQI